LEELESAGKLGAAGYIFKRFRSIGLGDVDIEPFPVVVPVNAGARTDEELDSTLTVEGQSFTIYPMWPNLVRTPKTPPNGISGRLIYARQGSLREFNGLDVTDSIVLLDLNCGPEWFNAPMLGARAVLFIEPEETIRGEMENKFLSIPVDLPRFWVPKGVADHLMALLKSRPKVVVTVKCDVAWETRPGYNIIGRVRGTDSRLRKQQVVIQSYYDSICVVPSRSPGAENAVSIAALLEIAKTFVQMPPKRTLLFVASSGHFQGLAGAKHFIFKRKRGARTDHYVRRLFSLAYDSRKELDEAADRVWEKEKKKSRRRRGREKEKTPEEKAEEQIKALGRIEKAVKAVEKNLKKYRNTLRKARKEDPNKRRPEDKLFSEEELAERKRLLEEVFAPRVRGQPEKDIPGIQPAIQALRAELKRAEPLAKRGTYRERVAALDQVRAKVEALGDALDFSEEGISLWFSIDLSSHNDTFGIFYKAYFYNYRENIQWKFSDIGKKAREYGELVAKELAINLGDAMVDGINAIQGKTWSVYMGGKLALDSEVATLAGIPGLGFATIDDSRYVVDTPFDVPARVDVENVFRQTRFLACLLHDMVSISEPKDLYRIDLQDNYCEVYGHLVEFDPKTSYFPDRPIPGSIAVARANTKTAMGVRCEVMDQVTYDGKLSLLGLPNARARGGKQRIEGYHLDEEDGHVDYAPDLGRGGAETYPIEIPMDMMEKPVTVVMFECLGMTIFDMIDQRFFTLLTQMYVFDAASEAQPQEYGYCLPLPPQQWVSYYEPVAVVYARPGTRLKVTMGASVLGLRFVLLNPERDRHVAWNLLPKREREKRLAAGEKPDAHIATGKNSCRSLAEGAGYLVDDYPRVEYTPYVAAVDMWIVDDHRAGVLADKGIENERVARAHNRAREFLEQARTALEMKKYDDFMVNARAAWSYESRAYPDVRKTETDVVKGIIFYLALLLPFSYFAERLLIAAREIRRQIAGWFGIFIVIFVLIAFVHPAFAITFTPAIIFLAFVILTLTVLVVAIIVGKFEEQMKQVKYEQTGVHTADVGRLSASSAAFSLGISNMRRRKTRTALTCVTLILLTFTVLSFTSVRQDVRQNRIRLPKEPPYNGLLIRDKTWAPLGEPTSRILTTEFGKDHPVAPRAWYFSAMVGQQSFLRVYRGVDKYYDATAMVGLTAEEALITEPQKRLEWGRWFQPGDSKVCIIPKGMAEKLDIGRADVGEAEVMAFGVPLRVIGVMNSSKFKRLVDLDGEQLTPVDYLLMQEQQQR
ncbi:MAG: M28 family peptidase, partial [Armatimonadota bacterium]